MISVYWERRESGLILQGSNDLRRWWTGMDYGDYFNTSRILSIFRCKNGRIDYPDTPAAKGVRRGGKRSRSGNAKTIVREFACCLRLA